MICQRREYYTWSWNRIAGLRCLVAVENWIWRRKEKSCAGDRIEVSWTEGKGCKNDSASRLHGSGERQGVSRFRLRSGGEKPTRGTSHARAKEGLRVGELEGQVRSPTGGRRGQLECREGSVELAFSQNDELGEVSNNSSQTGAGCGSWPMSQN